MSQGRHIVSNPALSAVQPGLTPRALWDQLCYPTAESCSLWENGLLENGCGTQTHPCVLMLMAVRVQVGLSNWLARLCWAGPWPMKLLNLIHFLFSIELIVGWVMSYLLVQREEKVLTTALGSLWFSLPVCAGFALGKAFPYPQEAYWFYRRPSFS